MRGRVLCRFTEGYTIGGNICNKSAIKAHRLLVLMLPHARSDKGGGLESNSSKNMVHLFEAKGVRVFSLVEDTRTVDAFSVWRGTRPFAFLNTIKTGEHGRFDAAHELGHLVLHRHGGPSGRRAEDEANRFASSFLMPAADVIARLPRIHTLNQSKQRSDGRCR